MSFTKTTFTNYVGTITATFLNTLQDWLLAHAAQHAPGGTDAVFPANSAGYLKNDGAGNLSFDPNAGASFWSTLEAGADFATTAPGTSTISMLTDQTANIPVGSPIRYTYGGTIYYGQVIDITASLLTFRGSAITTGEGLLTDLAYGHKICIEQISLSFPGPYASITNESMIANRHATTGGYLWDLGPVYFIGFDIQSGTADSGATQPIINLVVNGNYLSTSNGGLGISINGANLVRTGVDLNTTIANTLLSWGNRLEVRVTAGSNGDARNLVVTGIYVIP